MLIKMLRHGTGSAARAASYVLDEKDHMNIVRPHVEVLCGDPHLFAKIADSSPYKHKYTSAVIAFTEEDQPAKYWIKRPPIPVRIIPVIPVRAIPLESKQLGEPFYQLLPRINIVTLLSVDFFSIGPTRNFQLVGSM
ncbi:hypothetical protein [Acinetobacter colistiniresistens]|uniref:hypothetical protein n=1 Tax=Acinetobacter colistiniresistens TaxID=280145 RepID=UPI001D18FD9B|nr:hypothetical protein [Acinetobacter colistiniresistens]